MPTRRRLSGRVPRSPWGPAAASRDAQTASARIALLEEIALDLRAAEFSGS
jgi:hypothetical protein